MTTSTNRISKAFVDVDVDEEYHWSAGKMKQRHREAEESLPVRKYDKLILFTRQISSRLLESYIYIYIYRVLTGRKYSEPGQ